MARLGATLSVSLVAASFSALFLAGCGLVPPSEPIDFPINAAEMAGYDKPGTGSVKGEGFLKQRGGGVVTCAGNDVIITPATSYWIQRLQAVRGGQPVRPPTNPAALSVRKASKCNSRGEFEFSGLAAGKWLAVTTVLWEAGNAMQGGVVGSFVDVAEGQQASVILNQ